MAACQRRPVQSKVRMDHVLPLYENGNSRQDHLAELPSQNRQHVILLIIGIVALLLVLSIVYLIYSNWQRSRQSIKRLTALNKSISEKNEKLQLALLALQDSQQDNTRIIAMVAHDLRTPAANVQMSVDMLKQSNGLLSTDDRDYLEIISKSTTQTLNLIQELMHSYEKDTSNSKDAIDLETMVHDCVELMQLWANDKQQTITVNTVPIIFSGSREKIWRVISNLIINAIKFTPRHGHIQVRLEQKEHEAIIQVQDNGIGIPLEFQDKLFEMGKVTRRQGTEGEQSTGFGLAIVKQIILAYHGKIYVNSLPNQGTTFHVHLPIINK
ncbi:sensor histidine kinase [Parapedobacter tibetensis]|uniref:sensor histidine kinase n=1 Tax=Parapedobacter tibetensis TaxID=2972951 RepID=UPI00214D9D18|nr:HAMP domain-containing sensor histidine kinase [Parapedobacter tibetensis]